MSEATDSSKYFNLTNFGLGSVNEIDPDSARKSANELQEKLFEKLGLENVLEPFTLQTAHSAMKGSKHGLGAIWKNIYNKAKETGKSLTSRKAKQVADYYKGEGQKIADKSPTALNDYLADLQDNGFKNATLNAVDRGIKHTAARITNDSFIVGDGDTAGPITKEALDALDQKGPPKTEEQIRKAIGDRITLDGVEPEDDSMIQSDGVFGQTYGDLKGQLSDFDAGIFNWSDSDSAGPAPPQNTPVPSGGESSDPPLLEIDDDVKALGRPAPAPVAPAPAPVVEAPAPVAPAPAPAVEPAAAAPVAAPEVDPQINILQAFDDAQARTGGDTVRLGEASRAAFSSLLRPVPEGPRKFTPKLKALIEGELGGKASIKRSADLMAAQVKDREDALFQRQLDRVKNSEGAIFGDGLNTGRGISRSEAAGFSELEEETPSFASRAFSFAKNKIGSILSGSQRQVSGLGSLNAVGEDILEAPSESAFANPFGAAEPSGSSASDASSVASAASATEGRRFIPQDPQRSGRPFRMVGMGGEGQGGGGLGGGKNPWSRRVVDVNAPTQSGRDAMNARMAAFEAELSSQSDAESVKHQANPVVEQAQRDATADLFASTASEAESTASDEVAEGAARLVGGAVETGFGGMVAGAGQIIPAVAQILDPNSSAEERQEDENKIGVGEGQGVGQAVGGQAIGAVKKQVNRNEDEYAGQRVARSVSSDDSLSIAPSDSGSVGDASVVGSEVSGADALPPAVVPAVFDDGASVSSATTTGAVIGGAGADVADLATVEGIGAVLAPEISPLIALGDVGLFGLGLTGAILTNVLGNPTAPPVEHIKHIVNVAQQFGS